MALEILKKMEERAKVSDEELESLNRISSPLFKKEKKEKKINRMMLEQELMIKTASSFWIKGKSRKYVKNDNKTESQSQ